MAAQYPGALPSFAGMVGASTDPLGSPSLPAFATKAAEEIVAIAQEKDFTIRLESGFWYSPPFTTVATSTPVSGTLTLTRCEFPFGTTVVQLAENVAVAVASTTRQLAIYADDGTGCYPGALQKDAGSIDTSTTGIKSVTAFAAENVSGVRWIGGLSLGGAPGMSGLTSSTYGIGIATLASANVTWAGFQQTSLASLPSNFSTGRAIANSVPRTFFKTG